ncbi:hypothetical protein REPUB_Repub14bG0045700 [Reevesia pubescens]
MKSFFKDEGRLAARFFNAVWVTLVHANVKVLLVNVYGPCNMAERKLLWEALTNLIINCNLLCLITEDFNAVRCNNKEHKFCLGNSPGMSDFNDFIFSCNLVDILLTSKKFTWFGRENKRSKVDRFLISEDLLVSYPNLVVKALNKNLSDHVPLYLHWHCSNWGPIPFHHFNWWHESQGYFEIVHQAWANCVVTGWGGFHLLKKLKAVKVKLKSWVEIDKTKKWKMVDEIENDLDNMLDLEETSQDANLWNE